MSEPSYKTEVIRLNNVEVTVTIADDDDDE